MGIILPGTPEDYEPPGFKPFVGDSTDFVGTPMKWTCGKVSTSFHTLTVKAKQIQQVEHRKLMQYIVVN